MTEVLRVRGVTKRYGGREILRGIDLTMQKGDMVALTGRSGSGKTTLLRMIAGLEAPDQGEIVVDGADLSGLDDAKASQLRLRTIGMVFQNANLLPDLDLTKNVRLPMELAGMDRKAATARAGELLELVGLTHRATALPAQVSGGEAQRAAIARALANGPALLLADEPTGSLDRESAERVLEAFRDVHDRVGTTILLATHDPVAEGFAARRVHVEDGRLYSTARSKVTARTLDASRESTV